jgi:hypothetical protein
MRCMQVHFMQSGYVWDDSSYSLAIGAPIEGDPEGGQSS